MSPVFRRPSPLGLALAGDMLLAAALVCAARHPALVEGIYHDALFAALAPPLGWLADRLPRRRMLALALLPFLAGFVALLNPPDGFAGLDILRRRYPAMPVAVVSAFDDTPTITRVLNLGASGFIPKAFSGEALLSAVRAVLAGNIFRPSGQSAAPTLDAETPIPPAKNGVRPDEVGLTERQAQVLALMVRGLTNRDIADILGMSPRTVNKHLEHIFEKLGVETRTAAAAIASSLLQDA